MHDILYVSIETAKRELLSRLIVALEAAWRGGKVVIGQKWAIEANLETLPRGVVLYKTADQPQCASARKARELGHIPVSMIEEGLAAFDGGVTYNHFGKRFPDSFDMHLALTDTQHEALKSSFGSIPKTVVTGNPRIDLLRPKFRPLHDPSVDRIRKNHGNFILFNSNLAAINWQYGDAGEFREYLDKNGFIDIAAKDTQVFDEMFTSETLRHRITTEFFEKLTKKAPEIPIIIRPHPGENIALWEEFSTRFENCRMIRDDMAICWMAAAGVTVVTGCSTGIEGFLMGCPIVNLTNPDDASHREDNLTYHYIPTYSDVDEAVDTALAFMEGREDAGKDNSGKLLELQKLHHFDDGYAYMRIVDTLFETYPGLKSGAATAPNVNQEHLPVVPGMRPEQSHKILMLSPDYFVDAIRRLGDILGFDRDLDIDVPMDKVYSLSFR